MPNKTTQQTTQTTQNTQQNTQQFISIYQLQIKNQPITLNQLPTLINQLFPNIKTNKNYSPTTLAYFLIFLNHNNIIKLTTSQILQIIKSYNTQLNYKSDISINSLNSYKQYLFNPNNRNYIKTQKQISLPPQPTNKTNIKTIDLNIFTI